MSKRVQTELRTYMSYLDTQVAPTTIDETTEPGFGTGSVRPVGLEAQSIESRPRRPWLVAATSAAAMLLLAGGVAWLTQATGSDTPVADTLVPVTPVATDTLAQGKSAAASVFGHLEDAGYWEAPLCGAPPCIDDARMAMSDERLSGDVTFTHKGELFVDNATTPLGELPLYWGTMLIENDGGTWEGTHFAADHHAQPDIHGPIVMQLTGFGDYAGLSAILYRTVISPPGTDNHDLQESVDGMIFPGNLPPDRP